MARRLPQPSTMLSLALFLAAATADPLVTEMQAVESSRNAAIKAGDMATLEKIYASDFHGIAANGQRVDRATLFSVFKRNAGGDFIAESTILSARREGRLVIVEGQLKLLSGDRTRTISDGHYLHVFARRSGRWVMIEGAAVPIRQ